MLRRNPAWRYQRAYSTLIRFLVLANALPAFDLVVESKGWVGRWSPEGVPWHLNLFLGGLAALLVVLDYLTHSREEELETLRDEPATKQRLDTAVREEQFHRRRNDVMEEVRFQWIKGLLEPSLDYLTRYHLSRIELGLETRPDAVARPFDLLVQRPKQAPQLLPTGIPISHVFDEARKSLLILGAPGVGKTTFLLELTRDLLDRAAQDESHLIPVVFHLSSWAERRSGLADWLIDELKKRYDVRPEQAKTWVDARLILPLLDGLDEVAADHREACVETINAFLSEHGFLPIVVCSRVDNYKALTVHLRLRSAVIIRALSQPQVQNYVDQAGEALLGLRTVLPLQRHFGEITSNTLSIGLFWLLKMV